MTPKGSFTVNIAGFIIGMLVSAIIASIILKLSKDGDNEGAELTNAIGKLEQLKGAKSKYAAAIVQGESQVESSPVISEQAAHNIHKIIFACDAGMGSSAMGASIMNKKIKDAGLNITVTNKAINHIPNDADLVITHRDLVERARRVVPGVRIIAVENFLSSPEYDKLIEELKQHESD
jgi:PTS system mannitol-specific IIC component